MLVRAPLVEAEQDGSIRIQDLTKVVVARLRLRLAKDRLVPLEAARNVTHANDCPRAFHRIPAVDVTGHKIGDRANYKGHSDTEEARHEDGSLHRLVWSARNRPHRACWRFSRTPGLQKALRSWPSRSSTQLPASPPAC